MADQDFVESDFLKLLWRLQCFWGCIFQNCTFPNYIFQIAFFQNVFFQTVLFQSVSGLSIFRLRSSKLCELCAEPGTLISTWQAFRPQDRERESKGQKERWFPSGQSSDWLSTQLSWLGKPPPIIDGQLYPLHVLRTHSLEAGRDKTWSTVRFWFHLMVTFQAWTQADKLGQIGFFVPGKAVIFLGSVWGRLSQLAACPH